MNSARRVGSAGKSECLSVLVIGNKLGKKCQESGAYLSVGGAAGLPTHACSAHSKT
ncbi:predicted protein [Plenodomus lingam JN3]|uniref:Predicted protein n=1 Tax=Leptosphaeria maculans (strain JN3 / isolate v23.1.3 / race Av1-4-5-6-7-8) TaxID=985895 RepID=E4ZSG2_LEPMJ|nr:predicted protein [Plenodomus lingam JN3]CBX94342.1 predicted protein [Plenodomus lingam JN3]